MISLNNITNEDIIRERLRILCAAFNRRMDRFTSISVSVGCVIRMYSQGCENLFEKAKRAQRYAKMCVYNQYIIQSPEAVLLNNPKAKELLAILVDRNSGFVSASEAIECLWKDRSADKLMHAKCRKTALQLNRILEKKDIGYIEKSSNGKRRIVNNLLTCDYYQYLSAEQKAVTLFAGLYMVDHRWAEETVGTLEAKL